MQRFQPLPVSREEGPRTSSSSMTLAPRLECPNTFALFFKPSPFGAAFKYYSGRRQLTAHLHPQQWEKRRKRKKKLHDKTLPALTKKPLVTWMKSTCSHDSGTTTRIHPLCAEMKAVGVCAPSKPLTTQEHKRAGGSCSRHSASGHRTRACPSAPLDPLQWPGQELLHTCTKIHSSKGFLAHCCVGRTHKWRTLSKALRYAKLLFHPSRQLQIK